MKLTFYTYRKADILEMMDIWNDILEDGVAFPGRNCTIWTALRPCWGADGGDVPGRGRAVGRLLYPPSQQHRPLRPCGQRVLRHEKGVPGERIGEIPGVPLPGGGGGTGISRHAVQRGGRGGTRRRCGSTARRDSRRWG